MSTEPLYALTHGPRSWRELGEQQVLGAFQKCKKAAVARSREPEGEQCGVRGKAEAQLRGSWGRVWWEAIAGYLEGSIGI